MENEKPKEKEIGKVKIIRPSRLPKNPDEKPGPKSPNEIVEK